MKRWLLLMNLVREEFYQPRKIKEKFELTKNLFKAWQESSSHESKVALTQTLAEKYPVDAKQPAHRHPPKNLFLLPLTFNTRWNPSMVMFTKV